MKIFYKQGLDFRQGVQLPFPDAVYMSLPASVGHIVADESALKQFFENKGAGGKLLCMFCQNCVQRRYSPENTEGLVLHDSLEFGQLKLHTDRSIFNFVNHLKDKAATSTKKELEDLETVLGFNHCPQGLLQDQFIQSNSEAHFFNGIRPDAHLSRVRALSSRSDLLDGEVIHCSGEAN